MSEVGPFCFRNLAQDLVEGLHVTFEGATLQRAEITDAPPGRISISGNEVSVLFDDPVVSGASVCFTIWSSGESISIRSAFWFANSHLMDTAAAEEGV